MQKSISAAGQNLRDQSFRLSLNTSVFFLFFCTRVIKCQASQCWSETVTNVTEAQFLDFTGRILPERRLGSPLFDIITDHTGLIQAGWVHPDQLCTLVQIFYTHLKTLIFTNFLFQVCSSTCTPFLPRSTAGLPHRKYNYWGLQNWKNRNKKQLSGGFSVSALLHCSKPGLRRSLSSIVSVTWLVR